MVKFFKSRLIRSIVPYFVLGVFLIIAFRVISELGFFTLHLERFWSVLSPFFAGGIIAYILNLPCSAIQRLYLKINHGFFQRRSRGLSVLTLAVIIVALVTFSVNLIVPAVSYSITTFTEEFDNHVATFTGWIEGINAWDLPEFVVDNIPSEEEIIVMLTDFIEMDVIATYLMAGFGATFRTLFSTILITVSTIYFLIEKDRFKEFVKRLIEAVTSPRANGTILKYSQKLNHNFHMYIYAQTIDGIILGSLMTGLLLIFQSPHALLLGLILGVVNYIPYFGSIFGTAFAVVVVALTQGIPTAAFAGIFMFIIQQIDGNFIQPKLMGGSFSLSPLLVIISVTIGMHYGGVLGMLVAIPIVAILKDLLVEYVEFREKKKLETPAITQDDNIMDKGIW
ncbi:MAG: AI-2E family transporter [Defluviitaleaceae bacterium]|nr:AI-2E family transporter [Defluviitaleaceae bacterium]